MFGSIGTFTAHGSRFNNTTGHQYNTNVAPSAGVFGEVDPQWPVSRIERDTAPAIRKSVSMFGAIDQLDANSASFNNNRDGRQYNYNLPDSPGLVTAPIPTRLQMGLTVPAMDIPHSASAPPVVQAPVQSTEISPAAAEARMFGSITRLNTLNSDFNNAVGTQVNVHRSRFDWSMISGSGNGSPPGPTAPPLVNISPPANLPVTFPQPSSQSNNFSTPNPSIVNALNANPLDIDPSTFAPPITGPSGTSPNKLQKRPFFRRKKEVSEPEALALGVTDYVLTTLQNASRFSGVPLLPEAATAALSILQGVLVARDNQGGFTRLAVHGCNLISSVVVVYQDRLKEGRQLPRELMTSLETLVEKLQPIAKFVTSMNERHGFRGNIKKVILYKHEAAQVNECREKLTQALAEFGLRSNISVQDGVAQIDRRLDELISAMKVVGLQSAGNLSPPVSRPASAHSSNMQVEPTPVPENPAVLLSRPASAPAAGSSATTAPYVASTPAGPALPGSSATTVPYVASAPALPGPGTSAYLSPLVVPLSAPVTPPPTSQPGNGQWYNLVGSVVNNVGGNQINNNNVGHFGLPAGSEYIHGALSS